MNTVNYNDAEQLFGAVGTSLKEHTTTRAALGAHNLFGVGNSLNEWFAAMNDGKLPTNYLASDTITGTVNKDTNSIVITAYNNTGYRWGCKKINLKKNTRYTFSRTSCDGTIQLFGKNNADDRAVVITGLSNGGTVNSGDYDWWYVGFYPTRSGGYFSITDLLVRLETDADSTFQPYAKPNTELTKDTKGLTDNQFENGCVNLYKPRISSQSQNGVSFIVNSDYTISTSGTSNAVIYFSLESDNAFQLPTGRYHLSGCPSGGGTNSTFFMYLQDFSADNPPQLVGQDNGEGIDVDLISGHNYRLYIYVAYPSGGTGVNMNGKVFKPMITVADMPNSDYAHYVPYAKSNKELTDDISSLAARIKAIEDTNHLTWG